MAIIRRAALMHDIGLVSVPSFTLDKPRESLTQVEWERLRLHPYHAERILSSVSGLEPVVPLVAAHHERPDGSGYYRGLSGSQIPLGAGVIAVADCFDELTRDGPDRPALDSETALRQMRDESGRGFCADALQSLVEELGADGQASAEEKEPTRGVASRSDRSRGRDPSPPRQGAESATDGRASSGSASTRCDTTSSTSTTRSA